VAFGRDAALEVDFVLRDGPTPVGALQVAWATLKPGDTREPGVTSLVACLEALDLAEGAILTLDREERLTVRGRKVRMRPVWQFLLGR
jgi:hypothetical protein